MKKECLLVATATLLIASVCPTYAFADTNTFPLTGNVGIGTTSPSGLLTIGSPTTSNVGNVIRMGTTPAGGSDEFDISNTTGSAYLYAFSTASLSASLGAFNNSAGTSLILNPSGGNVGIGATSPDALLSLDGQAAQTIDMIRELTASTGGNNLTIQAGGAISGGSNLGGGSLILSGGISTGNNSSNVQFETYPAGSSGTSDNAALTALTISATGATGNNASTVLQANAGSGTNQNGGNLTIASGVSTGTGTSQIQFNVYGAGSSGSTANTATTAMTITPAGNVGIGTTSPASGFQFEVFTAAAATNAVARITSVNRNAGIGFYGAHGFGGSEIYYDSGTEEGRIYYDYTTNSMRFFTNENGVANSNERVRFTSTGAVGIGTTSPRGSALLDVNGTIYVGSFASSSSTTVCQNGNVLSTCTSALRFKEHIKPSQLGLKEVLAMKPVTFDFKDHSDNWEKHDFGFIAEDMEAINPLFVTYDKDGEVSGVRYMQLAAVSVKAIQEMDEKEHMLQREIEEQKNMIDQLKLEIQQLRRQ